MDDSDTPQPLSRHQFASDNYAGICPEAWEALAQANCGHAPAYGEDAWTDRAADLIRELFETDCQVFFTFNGTAANSLVLATLCRSYHSIICHEVAHVETDECGGPEFFSNGTKVLTVGGTEGKVDLEAVEHTIRRRSDIHYPKPRVLSITQATELGTVYSPDDLRAVRELADRFDLRVHMDGARFANAAATLGVSPKELSWEAGVDALCFGGTKNGIHVGDAVVFFDLTLAEEFGYRCKQAGQLASKMRFLSAPWVGLLETGAWLENARHANRCAALLAEQLRGIPGVEVLMPVEANSVFVQFPPEIEEPLLRCGWRFYNFIGHGGARLMCAWDTSEDDVAAFVRDVRKLCTTAEPSA